MKARLRWPTVRTAVVIAVTLAVVSFFLISNYYPRLGVFGTIMTGEIRLQPSYDSPEFGGFRADDRFFGNCGAAIPYRWILAVLAAFVGIVGLKHRKNSN